MLSLSPSWANLYILVGMVAVVSLAVLFSTLTNSSLTAVGAALVLVIVMLALGGFSVFDFLKPYLITSHFECLAEPAPTPHSLTDPSGRTRQLRDLDRRYDRSRLLQLPTQGHPF